MRRIQFGAGGSSARNVGGGGRGWEWGRKVGRNGGEMMHLQDVVVGHVSAPLLSLCHGIREKGWERGSEGWGVDTRFAQRVG